MRVFWGTEYIVMEFMNGTVFLSKRKKAELGQRLGKGKWRRNEHLQNAHRVAIWGRHITWVTTTSVDTMTKYPNMEQALTCFHSRSTKKQIYRLRDPTVWPVPQAWLVGFSLLCLLSSSTPQAFYSTWAGIACLWAAYRSMSCSELECQAAIGVPCFQCFLMHQASQLSRKQMRVHIEVDKGPRRPSCLNLQQY